MTPPTRLIVMAKAPVPGTVKTRLVPALGAAGAAALAARLLERAVEQAVAAALGPIELCVAPDGGHPLIVQLQERYGLQVTLQDQGDIGERMQRAIARALVTGPPVCLLGTDAPAIDAPMLRAAAAALTRHDAVFVPAFDGGYALVGLRCPQPRLFAAVPWSTAGVMAVTRERLAAAGLRWAELAPVHDIDEPADLQHLPPGWT